MPTRHHLVGFAILLTTLAAPAANAFEITPFIGYRFGTTDLKGADFCIAGGCPGAETQEDIVYGLSLAQALNERWAIELRFSRQEGDLDLDLFSCTACNTVPASSELELTRIMLSLERRFEAERFQPFIAFGVGFTHIETTDERFLPFSSIDEDRATLSVAAGARVPFSELLALRLEARAAFTDLPAEIADDLFQVELISGLAFRF